MMTVVILMMMVLTTATKTKMMIGFTCHGSRSLNFTQLRSKGLFLLSLRLLGSPPKKLLVGSRLPTLKLSGDIASWISTELVVYSFPSAITLLASRVSCWDV